MESQGEFFQDFCGNPENVATSYYIICSSDDFPAKILRGLPSKIFAGKSSREHIM